MYEKALYVWMLHCISILNCCVNVVLKVSAEKFHRVAMHSECVVSQNLRFGSGSSSSSNNITVSYNCDNPIALVHS